MLRNSLALALAVSDLKEAIGRLSNSHHLDSCYLDGIHVGGFTGVVEV